MRCANCGWELDECNESQPVCPRCGGPQPGEISDAEVALLLEVVGAASTAFVENDC